MARPIKDTPTLYGEDARRFIEHMENLKPLSQEKLDDVDRSYNRIMSIFKD